MATIDQLRDGYSRLNTTLIRGAGGLAKNLFLNLGDWREENIAQYQRALGPQLESVKQQIAKLQTAYYQQVALVSDVPFTPAPVPPTSLSTESLRNGTSFETVYRRPFASMYTQLSSGSTMTAAVLAGATRAFYLATTDAQLASRQAGAQQRQANDNIKFYRRTLTGAENCALCVVASTQRYRRGQLKPIHPGCDCGEEPFYGDESTPLVLDPNLLEATHSQLMSQLGVQDRAAFDAGIAKISANGEPLSDFTEIIVTRDHGEYGATLAFREQKFTSAFDLIEE